MGCVYIARGPKGAYIGKTIRSLACRQRQHEGCAARGDKQAFYRALRKYREWDWSVLFESDNDATLIALEIGSIALHRACGVRLYNETCGGQGTVGNVLSEEAREKIRLKAIGRVVSEATREKLRGKPSPAKSEQARKRISESKKAYWAARREAGLPLRHGKMTEEGRVRLSEQAKARWDARRVTGEITIGKARR